MGSILYRRYVIHKTLRKLYTQKASGNEDAYMKAIDTLEVKLYFPAYTRELLRLNYYVDVNQREKVLQHFEIIKKMKAKADNQIAMYSTLFAYFLDQKEIENAKECCQNLYRLLENRKEKKYIAMLNEVRQLDGIYLQHDTTWIAILEDVCRNVKDPESLSVLKYRLAKLYMMAQKPHMCKEALLEAISYTKNKQEQVKLNYLLHHLQELNEAYAQPKQVQ